MKTMISKMVSLFLVFGLFWTFQDIKAQDGKLSRQELKEVIKAQREANFQVLDSLLNSKSFVLEADFLQNGYGERIPVISNLNFIKVDVSNGILQTGINSGLGYNGVGGVTAEGRIQSWKITKDPGRLIYSLHFSLLTNIGYFDVFMTVTSDNNASATITGLWPGKLTWDGHLTTIQNSGIFKGTNSI